MKNLEGRVAAITGASSGIGRAVALKLARLGCHLALSSNSNQKALAETAAAATKHGVRVTFDKVDVAQRSQVAAWAKRVVEQHGRINLLINNAGVGHSGTVSGTTDEDFDWVMGINFWGVVYGTRAFLPHLVKSGEGHIVNVSSLMGVVAIPGMSAYHASKFAVRGYTESLRQELDVEQNGVSATCVIPGGVRTNILANGRLSESTSSAAGGGDMETFRKNFGMLLRTEPEAAADAIIQGVRRNARRVLIGPDVRLADGMQRLLPASYQLLTTAGFRLMGR